MLYEYYSLVTQYFISQTKPNHWSKSEPESSKFTTSSRKRYYVRKIMRHYSEIYINIRKGFVQKEIKHQR